jgi:hypothetical protein
MARRLLSGWLIALAALARSLALMFERAAAGPSEPAADPDPIMAELAARYPGAPAHWLAHVAEGMARTAEAGEVPLALTSDAMAWPEAALTPREGPAPEPKSAEQAVADTPHLPPPHPVSPATVRGKVEAVPTLEALRSRSSEVWRRPAVAPRRLARPVFAPPSAGPAPPRTASQDLTPTNPHQHRPRLTVRESFRIHPDTPEPPAPTVEAVKRQEGPSALARPVLETPSGVKSEPEARPGVTDAQVTARAASPIPPVAAPPPIATAVEPRAGETLRPAFRSETARLVPVDAAPVERPAPSRARRVRRAIFQALTGLRVKPHAVRWQAWTKPSLQLVSDTPPGQGAQRSTSLPTRPVFPTIADPAVPSHRTAPTIRVAPKSVPNTTPRRPRLVWSQEPSQVEPPRQASSPSVDDRWPAFPPQAFSPPPLAELPLPRLEQLAREQEEGRWSV